MLILLSLCSLLALTSLALYALWSQRKTHRDHIRDIQVKDTDLLDRLMFATGNQSYVRGKVVDLQEEELTEEERQEMLNWSQLG